MTIATILNGAALSASLIMAIGAQNTFVLRQGLTRQHIFLTALMCTLCDLFLMSLGVAGMGHLLAAMPNLQRWMAIFGTVFVLWYGFNAFKNALHPSTLADDHRERAFGTPSKVILAGLAFSFLNPHSLLDTVVLVGSIGAQQLASERPFFVMGAVGFSAIWFFSLAYGSSKLSHLFSSPKAWRILDIAIGFMMLAIAYSLIKMTGLL
ncbi:MULTISPECIES: LysE/ArgO family amino acid transporter [unclassified Iodobacter]|uniref:LysE/ArgO family amino acid transporter n=1 Tax=unclassified Iodobacter TaxID=235634 RepID=UPI0025E09B5A|nr:MULTISPECIES: LysE/ArgO family amino acid transporter [unclassified Iodobacter]MDW5417505.1 LysE/ArgO family amino acid transporter [Iodobacter sp. CM08]